MRELAAVNASIRARVGIKELLQSIASPNVSPGVIADALHLRRREWFAGGNVPNDPRLTGRVAIERCAFGSRKRRFANFAINHDRRVRVVRPGHARKEVAETSFQAGHH